METCFLREVYARYRGSKRKQFKVTGPESAAAFVRSVIKDNTREHFVALFLDTAHTVAAYAIVSVGTANATLAGPREVFQLAVLAGAAGLIVAHNHPGGQLEPSQEDIRLTTALAAAGQLMQIPLLDHLIVAGNRHVSFHELDKL